MNKICVVCGDEFQAKTIRAKYCCKVCANASKSHRTRDQIHRDNEEIKENILNLYNMGLNDRQISLRIGKCNSWVRQKRIEMGLSRQKSKSQRERERLAEWHKSFDHERRICKRCEAEFIPIRMNQLFCCPSCEKKNNHEVNDIKRKRLEHNRKVEDISLNDVFKKYNGICYLCGKKCDYTAIRMVNGVPRALGDYPSREHVKPLSKGGLHTWDNIRLAHIRCNASKGAKLL